MSKPLDEVVDRIVKNIQPERIILFGSRAREDYRGESDFDICVLKSGVDHRRKLAQNIYRMLYGVGIPVEIIVETPERFDELSKDPFLIYSEIAENGRVLYEKSD